MNHLRLSVRPALALALALAVSGCNKSGGGTGGFEHKDEPDNLKQLWTQVVSSMKASEPEKAVAMLSALIPDEASVKKALKDDVDPEVTKKLLAMYEQMKKGMKPEDAARGFKAERSKVWVHGAKTEQIAKGDEVAKEFPGGAKSAAETILRPGVTFYEVELTEPEKDIGTKFHLMYWDGSQWRMLGPVWRALR